LHPTKKPGGINGTSDASEPEDNHCQPEEDCLEPTADSTESAGNSEKPEQDSLESGQDSEEALARG
jgi:hypothetical protein